MSEILEVIETKSILIEVLDIFDGNFKAVCVAVEDLSDGFTVRQIEKDLEVSNYKKYENALIKCSELWRNDILKYQALASIDYNECLQSAEAIVNYIRLNDYKVEGHKARSHLKNIEKIIGILKESHRVISKISGKKSKYYTLIGED